MVKPCLIWATSAAVATLVSGCGSSAGDKVGGSNAPRVLHLAVSNTADQPGTADAQYFSDQVRRLSNGRMRVDVVYGAAGEARPDPDAQVVRMVAGSRFQLGFVGTRGWDNLGVESLQALQAPFLITSVSLLKRVVTSPLATHMLTGVRTAGVEGLALVPGQLRHPFGVSHRILSLADFKGAGVRINRSRVSEMLVRALGATPLEVANATGGTPAQRRATAILDRSFLDAPGGTWGTANITFYPKTFTLFAGRKFFDALGRKQRELLRTAALATARHAVASAPSEAQLLTKFCGAGRVALATPAGVAAIESAAAPVYTRLERNVDTHNAIAAIRRLKAATPADPVPVVPANCGRALRTTGAAIDPSVLNGTYRWRVTKAGAIAVGAPASSHDIGDIGSMTLRGGKWLMAGSDGDRGTYRIVGSRLVFVWPRVNSTLTFTFARRSDGTLNLKPVLPMDIGDRVVWAGGPWRRVGPPVRTIP